MFSNLTRHVPILRLVVLALLALCLVQFPARAEPTAINSGAAQDAHALYQDVFIPVGLARGQTLRYTWAYITRPPQHDSEFEPLSIQVKLFAAGGGVIAQAEAAAVGVGRFQSFNFSRDAIYLPGEPDTDRLQIRLEATVIGQTNYPDIVLKRGIDKTFASVLEIIDNASGRTRVGLGGGMNELILNDSPGSDNLPPDTFQIISAGNDYVIGMVPGQTTRFTVANPNKPGTTEPARQVTFVQVMLLDESGGVIKQSDEIVIPPGESRSVDFNRDALPLTGEPGTGRLQTHARVRYRAFAIVDRTQLDANFPTSLELINNGTGQTTLLISHKPKEIVVVGSN